MDLLTKIKDHSATVEVIGLGYVGLPPRHPICKDGIQRDRLLTWTKRK